MRKENEEERYRPARGEAESRREDGRQIRGLEILKKDLEDNVRGLRTFVRLQIL